MNMILKDLHDDDKGGWPDDDDEDDLDDYKVGLTWMICKMMIIDKKGGWPARPRGKGPQAASQPNTQVLTRPSTEGADTEQYTQYTEVLTRPPLMNTINTNPTPWYQSTTNIKIAHFWCTKQPECQNQRQSIT